MTKTIKSVRLDRELHKKAKIHCIVNNLTLGELVTKVLKEELRERRLRSD